MKFVEKVKSSIISAIVGDALGVPVQFSTRRELTLCSVKNMLGYGRYDQPEGTWSDDTSMILCTMESLCRGYDIEDMGSRFCKWLFDAYWTPCGYVFDAGLSTFMALDNMRTRKKSARESGCKTPDDNGNGSLMRILPAALYFHDNDTAAFLDHIHQISAITHAHPRSQLGCGIYSLFVKELLTAETKESAYRNMAAKSLDYYNAHAEFSPELSHFTRVLSCRIPLLEENDISSSGYIVDTLEAGIWCFMRHNDAKAVLLAAVNLGLDTDTTGTVAGGLAGLYYGLESIPKEWLGSLARKDNLETLLDEFSHHVPPPGQ